MESFSSVIKSNLNNRPFYYYWDSDRMNGCRRGAISKTDNMMGKYLFDDWGVHNIVYQQEESKVSVTMRHYTKRDISSQAVSKVMELITEICDCLHKKKKIGRTLFSLKTRYGMICVLEVQEYLRLLAEGVLKDGLAKNYSTCYISVIKNITDYLLARQLGTCGDYFVNHKQLLVSKQGVHNKIYPYINDDDICSANIAWLLIQKLSQQTGHNLRQLVITKLLPYQ